MSSFEKSWTKYDNRIKLNICYVINYNLGEFYDKALKEEMYNVLSNVIKIGVKEKLVFSNRYYDNSFECLYYDFCEEENNFILRKVYTNNKIFLDYINRFNMKMKLWESGNFSLLIGFRDLPLEKDLFDETIGDNLFVNKMSLFEQEVAQDKLEFREKFNSDVNRDKSIFSKGISNITNENDLIILNNMDKWLPYSEYCIECSWRINSLWKHRILLIENMIEKSSQFVLDFSMSPLQNKDKRTEIIKMVYENGKLPFS